MTTIQKALLQQFFPAINIALMEEIVDATPNQEVATEILCGIYVEPDVPTIVNSDNNTYECIMDSFDKWTRTVRYHYFTPKRISVYFPKSVNEADITEENYKELQTGSGDEGAYHKWVSLPSQMEKSTTGMELDKWMKLHYKNPVDMLQRALSKGIVVDIVEMTA